MFATDLVNKQLFPSTLKQLETHRRGQIPFYRTFIAIPCTLHCPPILGTYYRADAHMLSARLMPIKPHLLMAAFLAIFVITFHLESAENFRRLFATIQEEYHVDLKLI